MKPAILLTGPPGSGKTTLLRRVVAQLSKPAGGFYTQEIRHGGVRVGFEIVTLDGQRATLAQVGLRSPDRVGKYGVDVHALEAVAVPAIQSAITEHKVVVIDEIGPMEMLSPPFRQAVMEALRSESPLLATIVQRSTPFTDQIKNMPGVRLFQVSKESRDELLNRVLSLLEGGA
jgi:nucleoside-triphosphatase THEP1